MRLPLLVCGIERTSPTPSQGHIAAGAVEPSLTGKCYDNPTCENSILPLRGKKVADASTLTQCFNQVGNMGAWKAEVVQNHGEECFSLFSNYDGLLKREQARAGNFAF